MIVVTHGLAAPAALDAPGHDGMVPPAYSLARSLLPTAPPPVVEYNIPVVDVQRYQTDNVENMERVDWDSLQIVETHDDEGRIELISENQIYELFGLRQEEATVAPSRGI
ncbi:unnamed protein product [Urochloa humidicola]